MLQLGLNAYHLRFAQDLVQSPARAAVAPDFRNVSAQIQGIAESHHDGASCRAAHSVEVMSNGYDCSVALHGVRQVQMLGHGTTLEAKIALRILDWT